MKDSCQNRYSIFKWRRGNQTPAYGVRAIQYITMMGWQNSKQLTFRLFPKLGHALDQRDNYLDLNFLRISADTLGKLKGYVAIFLRL